MAKVLEGVPALSWKTGEGYTPIGSLKAVAAYLDVDVTYAWLMGVGGAAFRATWSPEWSYDMANYATEDLLANAAEWLSLDVHHYRDDPPNVVWQRIRESIDHGMPVLTCGLAGAPEYGIIAGYAEEPQRLHVRSYFQGADAYVVVTFQPWQGWNALGLGRTPLSILEPTDPKDRRGMIEESLRRALRFARLGRIESAYCEEHERRHVHVVGLEAYEAWVESLADLKSTEELELKAFAMALNLNGLIDARRAAGEYLQILAAMKGKDNAAYRRAAEHYAHEVSVLAEARRIIPYPFDAPAEAAARAAAGLANGRARETYAGALRNAREEEMEALEWVARAVGDGPDA
jgi:hypothetical protein